MSSTPQTTSLFDDIFSPEAEGVRITPDPANHQLTIDYIENHWVHSAIYESESYFDFVRHGALKWLYKQHTQQTQKIAELEEQVALLRQLKFGTSSEQSVGVATDEPQSDAATEDLGKTKNSKEKAVSNAGRKGLPKHLKRERKPYEADSCPCCNGSSLHRIGEEVTEQITIVPVQVKVIQHARAKYRCQHCEKVFTAAAPKHIIEKSSYASPEFLAHIACSKYQFGLPLYRQEKMFRQMGIPINRTTLANLIIGCSDKLMPLYAVFHEILLRQHVVHADETPFQVLKEPGRKATSKSQLWLYRSGEYEKRQIVLFDYQPSRSGDHPRRFLDIGGPNAFNGRLMTDAYAAYKGIAGIKRDGCMSHARRKFVDFIRLLPKDSRDISAQPALELVGKLYTIERRIKGMPHRERKKVRQEESVPILLEFKAWLDQMEARKVTPRSPLAKAVRYALDNWSALCGYVEDGRVAIDNNIAERDIRSVAIGRKNWLFADSVAGANANAIMYSLVETAKANGLNPFDYLTYVIGTMPTLRTANEVELLLPWNMPRDMVLLERRAA